MVCGGARGGAETRCGYFGSQQKTMADVIYQWRLWQMKNDSGPVVKNVSNACNKIQISIKWKIKLKTNEIKFQIEAMLCRWVPWTVNAFLNILKIFLFILNYVLSFNKQAYLDIFDNNKNINYRIKTFSIQVKLDCRQLFKNSDLSVQLYHLFSTSTLTRKRYPSFQNYRPDYEKY